jgi:hypothetical protein
MAGPLSQWLFDGLAKADLPVVCIETRHTKAFLKAQVNKTDKSDARGIAQMIRVNLFRPVHVKTLASQQRRALLTGRKLLQEKAIAIENDIRGLVRNFGLKVGAVGVIKFENRIRELIDDMPDLADITDALLIARRKIREQYAKLHRKLLAIVRYDKVCTRLMRARRRLRDAWARRRRSGARRASLGADPAGRAYEGRHGLLRASEVSQLKLNADWVVLSAFNFSNMSKYGCPAFKIACQLSGTFLSAIIFPLRTPGRAVLNLLQRPFSGHLARKMVWRHPFCTPLWLPIPAEKWHWRRMIAPQTTTRTCSTRTGFALLQERKRGRMRLKPRAIWGLSGKYHAIASLDLLFWVNFRSRARRAFLGHLAGRLLCRATVE